MAEPHDLHVLALFEAPEDDVEDRLHNGCRLALRQAVRRHCVDQIVLRHLILHLPRLTLPTRGARRCTRRSPTRPAAQALRAPSTNATPGCVAPARRSARCGS